MQKIAIAVIVTAIIVGAGTFFGGMQYGQSRVQSQMQNGQGLRVPGAQNVGAGFTGGTGQPGDRSARGAGMGGFTSGDILSLDSGSMTISLPGGGSKIVLFPLSVEVGKFVSGVSDDLSVGQTVSITGKTNTDGSLTAQSIQIRPPMPSGGATVSTTMN